MIETPRAALMIKKIAPMVDLISYGTNDLTQMTCGISRDDNQIFINFYQEAGIIEVNPFVSLDQELVGQLIKTTTQKAKKANPKIRVGLCGEQGGDPESVKFLIQNTDLDAVSCSPARVPMAVIAAGKYSMN
jgi:pyruvate,orthophosphate dikinase